MAKRKRGIEATKGSVATNDHAPQGPSNLTEQSELSVTVSQNTKKQHVTPNGVNGAHIKATKQPSHLTSDVAARSKKVLKTEKHTDVKTELPNVQIITGSYERTLHGITASVTYDNGNLNAVYSDSFLFNAHQSAVKCLALSPMPQDSSQGVYLATGGSDERVNVYSLSAAPVPEADSKGRKFPPLPSLGPNKISENPLNRELGTLVQHSSSITALHFPSRSKLLSASEDNTISITRLRDLEVISTVKAPRPKVSGQASGDSASAGTTPSGVNDFAIHPSLKLMVSVGRGEKCMRLWNLVTGKKAGVLNFDRALHQAVKEGKYSHGEGRKICWNKEGTEFAISFERGVVVFGQDSKAKCALMPHKLTKVHQINYFSTKSDREFIAVSTDDGKVLFFDPAAIPRTEDQVPVLNEFARVGGEKHTIGDRVKDFQILNLADHGYPGYLIVFGCSNGEIKLVIVEESELLNSRPENASIGTLSSNIYSAGSRITCLVAFIMLPPHNIEGGLSDAESLLGSEIESEDSSDEE